MALTKILSIVFLTINLFIGESISQTTSVELTVQNGDEVKTQILNWANGEDYYFTQLSHQGEYWILDSDSSETELGGYDYAIIVPSKGDDDISNRISVDGYKNLEFKKIKLTKTQDDGDTKLFADSSSRFYSSDFAEDYYICIFFAGRKIDSVSASGIHVNADDKLTKNVVIEMNGVPREESSEVIYFDANKFDEIIANAETEQINVHDALVDKGLFDEEPKLEESNRYYVFVKMPYVADVTSMPIAERVAPLRAATVEYLAKSKDFICTINGKAATLFTKDIYWEQRIPAVNDMHTKDALYYLEFIANDTTKQTDLVYSVLEEYEWVISSATQEDVDGRIIDVLTDKNLDTENVEVNVKVNKWALEKGNKLVITVDSLNGWNMVDQNNAGNKSEYTIKTAIDDTAWDETTPLITLEGIGKAEDRDRINRPDSTPTYKANGIFNWKDGTPKWAGTYKDTLTFTAEIKGLEMPKFGEKIKIQLNEGAEQKEFLVINVDGTVAEVMYTSSPKSFIGGSDTISFGDKTGIDYNGSPADTYLNGEWYSSLREDIKEAVVPKQIKQSLYSQNGFNDPECDFKSETNRSYRKEGEITITNSKYAYILDIDEVLDLLAKLGSPLTKGEKLDEHLLALDNCLARSCSYMILRTSLVGSEQMNLVTNHTSYGPYVTSYDSGGNPYDAYPAFQIDLSKVDFEIVDETTSR